MSLRQWSLLGCLSRRRRNNRISSDSRSGGHRFRPLCPIRPDDSAFFQEILRPEHLIQGVRHRDLRQAIYPEAQACPQARRIASGRVSRRLQLFRVHGLLFRVPKTNYYRLTKKGHDVMNTAVRFRNTDVALFSA
jgi:hypothetical protein